MGDIDVKVGLQVTGDASGAQQVDAAVRQVGETAKQVAQETADASGKAAADAAKSAADSAAAVAKASQDISENLKKILEQGTGEAKNNVDGLTDSLLGLSNQKVKAGADGITASLQALISGDMQQGLMGLSKTIMAVGQSVGLPGASVLAGIAGVAIAKVWDKLSSDSQKSFNAMGESAKEEFERITRLARQEVQIYGLQNAAKKIEEEFGKVQKLTTTVGDALRQVFNSTYSFQIDSLKEQLAAAGLGDDQRQKIQSQLDRLSKEQELVNNTLAIDRLKKQLEDNLEMARLEQEAIQRRLDAADASIAEMAALRASAKSNGVSPDALYDSATSEGLREDAIKELNSTIKDLAYKLAQEQSGQGGSIPGTPRAAANVASIEGKIAGLEDLKIQLLNFNTIAKREADALAYKAEGMRGDQDKINSILADSVKASADIVDAQNKLTVSLDGVAADVVEKASKIAEKISKYEETAALAIEAGVASGTAADDIVRQVAEGADAVAQGFASAADGIAQSIESAKAMLQGKQAELADLNNAIAQSPDAAASAEAIRKQKDLVESINELQEYIAFQSGAAETEAEAAVEKQKQAGDGLAKSYTVVGTGVSAAMGDAGKQIATSAKSLDPSPIVKAAQDVVGATKDLAGIAGSEGEGVVQLVDQFKVQLKETLGNWRLGATDLSGAVRDSAEISLDLANLLRTTALQVSSLKADMVVISNDVRVTQSQIRNMK